MPKQIIKHNQSGFGALGILTIIVVVIIVGAAGWVVYKSQKKDNTPVSTTPTTKTNPNATTPPEPAIVEDPTANWKKVDSIGGAYSIKVPDGWQLGNYPENVLTGDSITYSKGAPAIITTASSPYPGDQKRFTVGFTAQRSAESPAPQWQSPNPYGTEAVEDFLIGNIKGKRYSIEFTQTVTGITKGEKVYQYVFDLPNDKGLAVVYKQAAGDPDNLKVVEQAIKTIVIKS